MSYSPYELGTVCSRLSSGKNISAKYVSESGEYPVFGGNGLRGYTSSKNFEGCCAIIGRQGAFCGNVRFFSGEAYMTEHAVVVCANEDNDTRYLSYLLSTMNLGRLSGQSAQPGLSVKTLAKQIVYLPTLEQQKKVTAILSSLDDKIELNQRINNNLQQQADAFFPYLRDTSLIVQPLSDFVQIKHGYAFKGEHITTEDNGIVLVTPGNFCIGGGFKEEKCKFYNGDIPEEYILKPGSLIVTMTDLSKQSDTLGYGAMVPKYSSRVYLHNQRIGLVEKKNDFLPIEYIYRYLRSYEYHQKIVGSASGSTVKHTAPGRILTQAIPVPAMDILNEYAPVLQDIEQKIALNNYENSQLIVLRDLLLPKLISGEIDVSDILWKAEI